MPNKKMKPTNSETGNHVYLTNVKPDALERGDISKSSSFNVIRSSSKSSGFIFSLSNLENDFNKTSGLS